MPPLDSANPLAEIGPGEPAGPNLEFDPAFGALERAAQGKPEQQVGDLLIPAEAPDWKEVDAQAAALLDRTQDLRVLALLAVARLNLGGIAGYAAVTTMIRQLLEQRWEAVHPQLDPEDDLDPTLRANALLRLAEPGRVLRVLRDMPLAASVRGGVVSWRDIAVANGMIEPEAGKTKMTEAIVRAAFNETAPAQVAATREAIVTALDNAIAIPATFDNAAGAGTGPEFTELVKLLRDMQRFVDRYWEAKRAEAEVAPEEMVEQADEQNGGRAAAAVVTAANLGAITTRSDAILLMDLVRAYYERYEPSSPLPFLIDRARRLAEMDFMEILKDMAPDGLNQAKHIAGKRE
jgi:type VI secretion system protein ImpA